LIIEVGEKIFGDKDEIDEIASEYGIRFPFLKCSKFPLEPLKPYCGDLGTSVGSKIRLDSKPFIAR
jgi:hypothetical protein